MYGNIGEKQKGNDCLISVNMSNLRITENGLISLRSQLYAMRCGYVFLLEILSESMGYTFLESRMIFDKHLKRLLMRRKELKLTMDVTEKLQLV